MSAGAWVPLANRNQNRTHGFLSGGVVPMGRVTEGTKSGAPLAMPGFADRATSAGYSAYQPADGWRRRGRSSMRALGATQAFTKAGQKHRLLRRHSGGEPPDSENCLSELRPEIGSAPPGQAPRAATVLDKCSS